jgi:flavin-dependent dehydrogenase
VINENGFLNRMQDYKWYSQALRCPSAAIVAHDAGVSVIFLEKGERGGDKVLLRDDINEISSSWSNSVRLKILATTGHTFATIDDKEK